MENGYTWQVIIVATIVTAFLRFIPFILFGKNKKTPVIVEKLGKVLPHAIMGMLVVYCLKDTTLTTMSNFMPQLLASLLAIILHVWKRNTLLSIVSATVAYMILVQVVF